MAFGDRLKLARARAGLSLAALADQLVPRVSAQAINKYEKGEMMPSSGVLMALARTLGVSLDYFMSAHVAALDGIEFRKRADVTEKEKALVQGEVIDHVERYLAIEEILEIDDLPSGLDAIEPRIIGGLQDAEVAANELRHHWSLGGDPIPSMTALLEEKNIRVIEIDGPDGFFGLTCRVMRPHNKPPVRVVVRRHVTVERSRFTMAHELAHAVIADARDVKAEKAMDRFAAAFLMPADHLVNEVGRGRTGLAYVELVRLKHMYGVSMWALLMRLRDVGVISEAKLNNLFKTPARAWLKAEPEQLDVDGDIGKLERPQRFEAYVYRALAEGLISAVKAASLLKRSVSDVEKAVIGPA